MVSTSRRENVASLRVSKKLLPHVDHFDVRHRPLLDALAAARSACTCRARRCSGSRDSASRSRAPPPLRPPAPARWRHRARCIAAFPAACSSGRAPRRPPPARDSAPARTRPSASPPPLSPIPPGCAAIARRARHRETRNAESPLDRRSDERTARPSRASARSRAPAAARCAPAPDTRRSPSGKPRSCPIRSRPRAGRFGSCAPRSAASISWYARS